MNSTKLSCMLLIILIILCWQSKLLAFNPPRSLQWGMTMSQVEKQLKIKLKKLKFSDFTVWEEEKTPKSFFLQEQDYISDDIYFGVIPNTDTLDYIYVYFGFDTDSEFEMAKYFIKDKLAAKYGNCIVDTLFGRGFLPPKDFIIVDSTGNGAIQLSFISIDMFPGGSIEVRYKSDRKFQADLKFKRSVNIKANSKDDL